MPFLIGLPKALREAGVAVVLEPGWETRGNPHFDPKGVVCHHTGPGGNDALIRLCINGRSDLPGPLANVVLTTDGVAHVIAAGRANHAGTGGWQGLSGNSQVFGIEAVHPGDRLTPWPVVQVEAYEKICAGLCKLAGVGAERVCGHKEWAPARKIDPTLSMPEFRARVAARLTGAMGAPVPERKIMPQYDPPLGPICGVLQDEAGKVLAAVAPDGSVYAWGVPYVGHPAGKDYFAGHMAALIIAGDDPRVPADRRMAGTYAVVATDGAVYGPGAF